MTKKRRTHDEYTRQLSHHNPELTVLEAYINNYTKILHRHNCGYEWNITPNLVLHPGKRCPKCYGTPKKSHEYYVDELARKNPEITVVEQYKTVKTKILHRHICGYEWMIAPNTVLGDYLKGCPICSRSGFKVDKPAVFYYFPVEYSGIKVIKYGISNDADTRIGQHKISLKASNGFMLGDATIQNFDVGLDAIELERFVGGKYKGLVSLPIEGFKTEVIPYELFEEFITIVEKIYKKLSLP